MMERKKRNSNNKSGNECNGTASSGGGALAGIRSSRPLSSAAAAAGQQPPFLSRSTLVILLFLGSLTVLWKSFQTHIVEPYELHQQVLAARASNNQDAPLLAKKKKKKNDNDDRNNNNNKIRLQPPRQQQKQQELKGQLKQKEIPKDKLAKIRKDLVKTDGREKDTNDKNKNKKQQEEEEKEEPPPPPARQQPKPVKSATTTGEKNVRPMRIGADDPIPVRKRTETGIKVDAPALYEGVDLHGDSSTATVMGMATGYDLHVYERLVGTLRKTGFKGHIILGVAPTVEESVLRYFAYRNVTAKILKFIDCTYTDLKPDTAEIANAHKKEQLTCAHPYPDVKIRWSRFPLIRDWLKECKTCTGPVLIMDTRDSFFQRDPFGEGSMVVKGLQVYEEHKNQTTDHWITMGPISECKKVIISGKPMLCSGTTVGTRVAMLKYLEIMYAEMKVWIQDRSCHFNMNGDDQSIHNYLYYTGQLPFATAIPNRGGGIVNTVGKEGALIAKAHAARLLKEGIEQGPAMWQPFEGADYSDGKHRWIGEQYNLIDDQGYFTEFDGSRSRVIHQFDRFGRPFVNLFMERNGVRGPRFQDPVPANFEYHHVATAPK